MKTNKMTLRKWYSSSLNIPTYSNYAYGSFVASCIGIVKSIVKRNMAQEIKVKFSTIGTACANQESCTIEINRAFVVGYVNGIGGIDERLKSDESISLILGLIVHEAAHFAWSPPSLEAFSSYVKGATPFTYIEQMASILGNVVEDIYIEAEVDRTVPSLTWMMDFSNELFFSDDSFEKCYSAVSMIEDAPVEMEKVGEVVNLLIYAKTRDEISDGCTDYIKNLFELALSARGKTVLQERLELVLELYDALMVNVPKTVDIDEPMEGKASISKSLEGASESIKGGSADHSEGAKRKIDNTLPYDASGTDVPEMCNKTIDLLNNAEVTIEANNDKEEGRFRDNGSVFVENFLKPASIPLEMDNRYVKLGEVARQRASVNRPYGLDSKRGHSIRKLYRIATDSKIFAESQPMTNYQAMEVIILIDCSGSMMRDVRGERSPRGRGMTSLEKACNAALGAAYGLNEGRCLVGVYGHTADCLNRETTIYTAKSFRDPINNLAEKMETMVNSQTRQNRDGFAVRFVGKKFTKDNRRRKLLIVISDGEPYAFNYGGTDANEHTRDEVNKLRKSGIDVLSISITREAMWVNNEIYGEKHNIYNEDPNVIEGVINSLLLA